MTSENPEATAKFTTATQWRDEMLALRAILLDCGLTEEVKWNSPCYTYDGGNVVILWALKDGPVIGFFKGALLSDPNALLVFQGKNSQAAKAMNFQNGEGITQMEPILRAYVKEAIALEVAGVEVDFKRDEPLELVQEIKDALAADLELKTAFYAMTRGRQRGYNIYVSGAKQSKTRMSRILGHKDRIMAGKGIHDCICGLSKRMPRCDGSHKTLKG